MGNESPLDQVIILADTYDTCDHLSDGYYIQNLEKFNKIYYFNSTNQKYASGRFIVIHRKSEN